MSNLNHYHKGTKSLNSTESRLRKLHDKGLSKDAAIAIFMKEDNLINTSNFGMPNKRFNSRIKYINAKADDIWIEQTSNNLTLNTHNEEE